MDLHVMVCLILLTLKGTCLVGCDNVSRSSEEPRVVPEKPAIFVPQLHDGDQATLTCSAPDPCNGSAHIIWWLQQSGKIISQQSIQNHSESFKNNTITSDLVFTPTSQLHGAAILCDVTCGNITNVTTNETLRVTHFTSLQITGNVQVKEGSTLTLKCSAERYPEPINITWSSRRMAIPLNCTTQDSLNITNVSRLHTGEYVCTAEHFNKTLTTSVNITVINAEESQSENYTSGNQSNRDISSENTGTQSGFTKWNISTLFKFSVAVTSSSIIICAVVCVVALWTRYRTHKYIHEHTSKEDSHPGPVKSQEDADPKGTYQQVLLQGQPTAEDMDTAVTPGNTEDSNPPGQDEIPEGDKMTEDGGARDVDYACINYSLLQDTGRTSTEAPQTQSDETDYAEIRLKSQDGAEEDGGLQPEVEQGVVLPLEGGVENQVQVELEERDLV
ncbi:uncharacterized protein LOC143477568 [Brachyhypopomus gauderio]|uniref:uncharacterized protein LOC143477568 n=1 Tax=Brachyhypopomus gauderio TaxID=698409 RepID=UPI0040414CD7